MSKQKIKIERLEIRLKGVSAERARAITANLGTELMEQLAGQTLGRGRGDGRSIKIARIDSGTNAAGAGEMSPAELRSLIVRRIAASIGDKFK